MSENLKYIDLQVNGYAGIDFNSLDLTEIQMEKACLKLEEDNVEGIFATLITDASESMLKKIELLVSFIERNEFIASKVKGLHIEGPFISPVDGYRGAHPKEHVVSGDVKLAAEMLNAGKGKVKMFTLAPECDPNFEVTEFLNSNNVLVSAGHTNASYEQLLKAISKGLKLFTHLGNGSPSVMPRHDNIVNRVLSLSDKLHICFIADGIHIPAFVLKNYLRIVPPKRAIIVTDCISAASAPPGRYSVSNINVQVDSDRVVREVGKENLAGSAVTMKQSEEFFRAELGMNDHMLEKLLYQNASELIAREK